MCRSCGHTLAWYDLVPIASFLILSGKCRYCRKPISPRYPVVEAVTGTVLALSFVFAQPPADPGTMIVSIYVLLVFISLFFFDSLYMILPDALVIPAIGIVGLYDLVFVADPRAFFISALLLAGFFAILYTVSRGRWLGFGDVKFAALIGLVFGYPVGLLVVVLGIWIGAAIGVALLISGRAGRGYALPFGAFLSAAAIFFTIFQHEATYFQQFFR